MIVQAGLGNEQFLRDVGIAETIEAARLRQLLRDIEDALRHRFPSLGSTVLFCRHALDINLLVDILLLVGRISGIRSDASAILARPARERRRGAKMRRLPVVE